MAQKDADFRLPDSVRKSLLRDTGHTPEDWHPDAHFRRETPPLRPIFPTTESPAVKTLDSHPKPTIVFGKAMLGSTDIGRNKIQ